MKPQSEQINELNERVKAVEEVTITLVDSIKDLITVVRAQKEIITNLVNKQSKD